MACLLHPKSMSAEWGKEGEAVDSRWVTRRALEGQAAIAA